MVASKVQDRDELLRWFGEGRTYKWMQEQYLDKYNIEISASTLSDFRRREGLPSRIVRDPDLIPWKLETQHRFSHEAALLRALAREREGHPVKGRLKTSLDNWLARMEADGTVLDYDPEQGFHYVKRRKSDRDVIRSPRRVTARPRLD